MNFFNDKWRKNLEEINKGRALLSKDSFLNNLSKKGYNLTCIEIVYDEVKKYLPKLDSFSIFPNDNLIDDYNIDNEDVEDIIERVFKSFNTPPQS